MLVFRGVFLESKAEYPPGNDHIAHLWKRKIISSQRPPQNGHVSFLEDYIFEGYILGSLGKKHDNANILASVYGSHFLVIPKDQRKPRNNRA